MHHRWRLWVALVLVFGAVAGCGGDANGDDEGTSPDTTTDTVGGDPDGDVIAQVASYELVANQDQRFLAALAGNGTGTVVSFGKVDLAFFYLGTREKPLDPGGPRFAAKAAFLPVAGQNVDPTTPGPKEAKPSEGLGVYAASGVRFDAAGFWGVTVKATLDGREVSANASFEVYADSRLPFPGQPAPRTDNPVAGAAGVDPEAIDSRAADGEPIPDAALHTTSVAAAIASGKPTVLVISTPVYCVSRFCGPVTDTVAELAAKHGDRAAFIHIEVWKDFEKKIVNPAAAEWIMPKGGLGDAQEPWIYLIDGKGIVSERFDNVVNGEVLDTALVRLLA